MLETCSACGRKFTPQFAYQVATTPVPGGAPQRRFFCSLDECSSREAIRAHPALPSAERERRIGELLSLVALLLARLDARASGRIGDPSLAPESTDVRARAAAVRTWSRVQLELLTDAYGLDVTAGSTGESGRRFDREALAEGFLAFAGGLLRLQVVGRRGIGEPDGAHYFAFAEFALLAIDLGIDREAWEELLAPLVWTQEVFAHMQRPPGEPPHRFHEFAPRGRERVFDARVAVRARESALALGSARELAELHAEHCRETFGDRQPGVGRSTRALPEPTPRIPADTPSPMA